MDPNSTTIKVGSRGSRLATIQVAEVQSLLKKKGIEAGFELITFATQGDKDKKTPLTKHLADDFFTDRLDEALLNYQVDIAVHSAKDLPQKMREGLSVFALTASLDETDAFVGKVPFAGLKSGAKIGTSSEVRQKTVKELKPDARIVQIRGTIEERIALVEKRICDGIIVATAALKRLGLEEHIRDIMPWEAAPLQGQLAVVGRNEDTALKQLFSAIDKRRKYGRVSLVGAGPGDPSLITLKGVQALETADCVFYDFLTHKNILDHAQKAEKIYAGKRKGAQALPQAELVRQLRKKAQEGKNVVRLKGGDPLIFGRGAEEIVYLRAFHIPVKVVPGVSSATAVPASLSVPLTARDVSSSVAFISGHGKGEENSSPRPITIPDVDTVVFLMGLTKLEMIVKSLRKAGWKKDTPMLVVSRGTCDDEHVIAGDLSTIVKRVEDEQPQHPALIIAGETVNFFDPHLYQGKGNILFTGTNPKQFGRFGNIIHWPMIEIAPEVLEPSQVKGLIASLPEYPLILLTSKFAVKYFFKILEDQKYDFHQLKGKDFLVIGESTQSALREQGFSSTITAQVETSEGLLEAITRHLNVKGKKILFPRSSLPNPYLKDELTKRGAQVDPLTVYRNLKPQKRDLPKALISKILFTSPSTVRNFLEDYGRIPEQWKILSKGPLTSRSLKDAGYESEVLTYD